MLTPISKKSGFITLALTLLLSFIAACQSTPTPTQLSPGTVTFTPLPPLQTSRPTPKPAVTRIPTDTPDEIDQYCCADYRIALLQAPATLNYWAYLGEDRSFWTGYVIGDEAPSLYEFPALRSADRLDFVPALAQDMPSPGEQDGSFWVMTVKLLENATWSDGEPITAHDLVFTVQTVFGLQLGGRWSEHYPAENLAMVKALDDHTVSFYFHEQPGISEWQFGVAMGPILPKHYWETYVTQAYDLIAGIQLPESCDGELSGAQQAACQAYAKARQTLYDVEPVSPPSGGDYATVGFTSDRTLRRKVNPNFYATGIKINEYANGAWTRIFPDGSMQQFYGESQGEPLVSYRRGPFNRSVEFIIYESYDQAYMALSHGRVDYVLSPNNLPNDWRLPKASPEHIVQYINPQNRLAYLAFNLRRQPFDRLEFRQALEILMDRQRMAEDDLQGLVYPAYTIMPPLNAFWWNSSLEPGDESPLPQVRLESAVQILKDAGWSWKTEPAWDARTRRSIPGEGLRLPDGNPMPETNLIFPAPETDLLLATFGQEITDLLLVLGVPVVAESLEREIIINRVLIAGGRFDLYIFDWHLPLSPAYLCALFYGEYDTLLTGGYNTTAYSNPRFDALCDDFWLETDASLAQNQVQQMQTLLAENLPYIPLFYPQVVDLLHENVILPYLPELDGIAGQAGFQGDARVLNR